MNNQTVKRFRKHLKDWLCIAVLFIYGVAVAFGHFESLRQNNETTLTVVEYLYGPALMMACGRGFFSPDERQHPELQAFLQGKQESFFKEDLPDELHTNATKVAAYHRYLLYLVAAIWKVFGIHWRHIEVLNSLMLGWYAASLFVLLRFFLSRIFSFISTLIIIFSPTVLIILTDLRDFSKAPFTITILCVLVWLFKNRFYLRRQIIGAAILGLVHGIALGFRQDVLVLLPLCVALTVYPLLLKGNTARWKRTCPLLLYLILFSILARPLMQHMEGGSQPQHVLVQGFANDRMDVLGMKEAPYQALLSGADFYTFSVLSNFSTRSSADTPPVKYNSKEAMVIGNEWLKKSLLLFPADIVTRSWAAVFQGLRYSSAFYPGFSEPTAVHKTIYKCHYSLAFFFHRAGLFIALCALIFVALRWPAKTVFIFIVSAYILGYTSLQASMRHVFHLSFFVFLTTGYCIESFLHYIRKLRFTKPTISPKRKKEVMATGTSLVLCLLIMVVPIIPLRWFQTKQLYPIFDDCIRADRTPLETKRQDHLGWTSFFIVPPLSSQPQKEINSLFQLIAALLNPELSVWNIRTRYLMAEFKDSAELDLLLHNYGSLVPDTDFSQLLRIPKINKSGTVLRYFFPVYELIKFDTDGDLSLARNHFRGISIPESVASEFLGLYEVNIPNHVAHLMPFVSIDNETPSPLFQRLSLYPDPLFYYHTEHKKMNNTIFTEAAQRFTNTERAVQFAEAQLILSDSTAVKWNAVQKLVELSELDKAIEGISELKPKNRKEQEVLVEDLCFLARIKLYDNASDISLKILDAIEQIAPEEFKTISLLRIEVYERIDLKKEALEIYQSYLQRYPEEQSVALSAHILMSDLWSPEGKLHFWSALTESHADQAHLFRYLALAYDLQNEEIRATEAYEKAFDIDPADPKNRIAQSIANIEESSVEEGVNAIRSIASEHGEEHFFIVERLEKKAWYMSEKGKHHEAATLLLLAAEYSSHHDSFILRACQQLTGAGEYEEAEEGLLNLLEGACAKEAAQALYITTKLGRDFPERIRLWETLLKQYSAQSEISTVADQVWADAVRGLFSDARFTELQALNVPQSLSADTRNFCLFYQDLSLYLESKWEAAFLEDNRQKFIDHQQSLFTDLDTLHIVLIRVGSNDIAQRVHTVQYFMEETLSKLQQVITSLVIPRAPCLPFHPLLLNS